MYIASLRNAEQLTSNVKLITLALSGKSVDSVKVIAKTNETATLPRTEWRRQQESASQCPKKRYR